MSSSIFYKFKSQREPSQITFDGTSLSVFEVKREIITLARLGDGTDFDLTISDPDTKQAYDDDTVQIPRSTTVVAHRKPAVKQGAGRAARYVSGKMPISAKNQHRLESTYTVSNKGTPASNGPAASGKPMTEEEKLQAMFSENKASWQEAQAEIAAKGVNSRPFFHKTAAAPDKPLPPGYTCHRCGQKGHWIQSCPTNDDPMFDGRPKFRRTTGIPRSMLKVVDKPEGIGENGAIDVSKLPPGVMYTADGQWVIAKPDEASWEKFQEKNQAVAEKNKEAEADKNEARERGLVCSLNHKMFFDPVKTPCCGTTYCRDCIENNLMDNDFACPNCGEQALIDDLQRDEEAETNVKAFKDEKKAARLQKDKETSKSPSAVGTPAAVKVEGKSPTDSAANVNGANSPASSTQTAGKKRSAEEELENNRKPPTGPAEMKKTDSKGATPSGPAAQSAPPVMPKDFGAFVQQMNSMAGVQGGMPAFNNPMMMNPMMNPMMGMPGMPGMPNPMMMNPMMGMGNMNMGMGAMGNMGNMSNMGMYGPGGNNSGPNGFGGHGGHGRNNSGVPTGPRGWQGNQQHNQQQQGWGMNGGGGMRASSGTPGPGADGAYFRQPINPHRHQGKQRRQRSVDYKQM